MKFLFEYDDDGSLMKKLSGNEYGTFVVIDSPSKDLSFKREIPTFFKPELVIEGNMEAVSVTNNLTIKFGDVTYSVFDSRTNADTFISTN